jgi:hypothetical protein
MKKIILIVLSLFLAVSTSTSAFAAFPNEILIMLREFWPGVDDGTKTVGATAAGNYFNTAGENLGTVILMWDSDGENIEACSYTTNLIAGTVILQSHNRRDRLVLRVPIENNVVAQWLYDYDDPEFNGESRILLGYEDFLNPDTQIAFCESDDNARATIAAIVSLTGEFIMEKRWWGTWGDGRYISEAVVTDAYLDHSPNIFPAIIATLKLERYF